MVSKNDVMTTYKVDTTRLFKRHGSQDLIDVVEVDGNSDTENTMNMSMPACMVEERDLA